jgi:hypothetical protein
MVEKAYGPPRGPGLSRLETLATAAVIVAAVVVSFWLMHMAFREAGHQFINLLRLLLSQFK